jgi:hypothetical protein
MPLIRLKERCFIFGHLHERGATVPLPAGMLGPHRATRVSADRIDYSIDPAIDANRIPGDMVDVPLYDVIEEPLP